MFFPTAKSKEPERVTDAKINRGEFICGMVKMVVMSSQCETFAVTLLIFCLKSFSLLPLHKKANSLLSLILFVIFIVFRLFFDEQHSPLSDVQSSSHILPSASRQSGCTNISRHTELSVVCRELYTVLQSFRKETFSDESHSCYGGRSARPLGRFEPRLVFNFLLPARSPRWPSLPITRRSKSQCHPGSVRAQPCGHQRHFRQHGLLCPRSHRHPQETAQSHGGGPLWRPGYDTACIYYFLLLIMCC